MLVTNRRTSIPLLTVAILAIFVSGLLCIHVAYAQGRVIDLYTQKGGEGQGVPGGVFTLGETVELTANLTYNGYPVQSVLVGFGVSGPGGFGSLGLSAITNESGYASVEFTIPRLQESFGTWNMSANSQLGDVYVLDYTTLEVVPVLPRSPKASFTENVHEALVYERIYFDASLSEPGFDGDDTCPIVEYRWDFGDGNQTTTTLPTIYHVYSSAGEYNVTLTVYAPGIPTFIDPQYVNLNSTYPPQRKVVHRVPVGGYSQPFENSSETNLITHVFAPAEMLTIAFVVLGRKRTRTKLRALKSRFFHF